MIQLIFNIGYFFIRFSGIAYLCRFLFSKGNVSILVYHNPSKEVFEEHLKYLSSRYRLISLSDYNNALHTGNDRDIPDYAAIITLDDGWKENFELLSIFRKYQFKPTLFLTSHLIDTCRHFWWTVCEENAIERFKKLPNEERLAILKEQYGYYPDKAYEGRRQALNKSEIEAMTDHVEIGLHTRYHPILTKCNQTEKRKEIFESKERIEKILGIKPKAFAYPNGDYDDECIEILKECGIEIGRTTDTGWNNHTSDPHKLRVTCISDDGSLNKLVAELTGIPMYFQYLFEGSINGKKNRL